MSEWKSIETAPMDGTTIDLFVVGKHHDGMRCTDCWFENGKWLKDHYGDVGIDAAGQYVGDVPTHWMPLPAAPVRTPNAAKFFDSVRDWWNGTPIKECPKKLPLPPPDDLPNCRCVTVPINKHVYQWSTKEDSRFAAPVKKKKSSRKKPAAKKHKTVKRGARRDKK